MGCGHWNLLICRAPTFSGFLFIVSVDDFFFMAFLDLVSFETFLAAGFLNISFMILELFTVSPMKPMTCCMLRTSFSIPSSFWACCSDRWFTADMMVLISWQISLTSRPTTWVWFTTLGGRWISSLSTFRFSMSFSMPSMSCDIPSNRPRTFSWMWISLSILLLSDSIRIWMRSKFALFPSATAFFTKELMASSDLRNITSGDRLETIIGPKPSVNQTNRLFLKAEPALPRSVLPALSKLIRTQKSGTKTDF